MTHPLINIPPSLQRFQQRIAAPTTLYLVGGGVRNALLNLPVHDYDLTGTLLPEELQSLAHQAGYDAVVRSSKMGTVEIKLEDKIIEYTTFRIESYAPGGGHEPTSVVFTGSLEQDALRRDFSVNALYADLSTGQIQDPVHGLQSLMHKQLVACRPNAVNTLKDDGLRLLRMARFAGELGFSVRADLLQAAQRFSPHIQAISKPRIWSELSKIILADKPYQNVHGHAQALQILDLTKVLYVLIPELWEGHGIMQNKTYHAYDVLGHNMATFAASAPDAILRWASLLHDVGKPRAKDADGHMIGHDRIGADLSRQILDRLGSDHHTIEAVSKLIARHMFDLNGSARCNTVRKYFATWGFDFTEKLIALRRNDIAGSGQPIVNMDTAAKWDQILQDMRAQGCIDDIKLLKITGKQIMEACNIPPSPLVGRIKQALFEQCAMDAQKNNADWLLKMAPNIYQQFLRQN